MGGAFPRGFEPHVRLGRKMVPDVRITPPMAVQEGSKGTVLGSHLIFCPIFVIIMDNKIRTGTLIFNILVHK